ncbi:hypothetical protein FTO74_09310 [Granulicella sp. WH15]|uniref:hypothetical protein n=1 Tax=Granulicella sp. WH15 TaxID=2602070 RepID=UPI0013675295|nr:hypothetical protein [Granulicella sp. WH15]QHN03544.1 hypothetical protein FTO74_09310 [Granulicella sp. WH15]
MGDLTRGFTFRSAVLPLTAICTFFTAASTRAQVFTVGEKTAMADVSTEFTPTRVALPETGMTERGRRELIRNFEAEQGFAHRALPLGASGLTLIANGKLTPGGDEYRHVLYEKGQSAGPGDRIVVTGLEIKGDRIVIDLNGGPYVKHRFLRHIQINDMPLASNFDVRATGARVTLIFEGGVPEVSAPEVKALLEPVLDFGVKTGEQAYADTLPAPMKNAIASHEVLVGMNRRMVLAALGPPENKLREHGGTDGSGIKYEEWMYGHAPQTIRFVRFEGDKVTLVKIAEMGKSIEVHDRTEVAGYVDPGLTREIAEGDVKPDPDKPAAAPPSLRKPGEKLPEQVNRSGQVQMPVSGQGGGIAPLPEVPGK